MDESKAEINENEDKKKITYIQYNGRTFIIIEHFSKDQTYLNIVKNALRREFDNN